MKREQAQELVYWAVLGAFLGGLVLAIWDQAA